MSSRAIDLQRAADDAVEQARGFHARGDHRTARVWEARAEELTRQAKQLARPQVGVDEALDIIGEAADEMSTPMLFARIGELTGLDDGEIVDALSDGKEARRG